MEGFFILEVGRRIKQKRLDKRMTLQELADKSGVSKGLVSQIENGRTIPSLSVMFGIIQSLEIEVSEFFKGLSLLEPTIMVNRKADYSTFEKENVKGFNYKRIMMRNIPSSTIDFVLLDLGHGSYCEELTTDAYEFIYVIKGQTESRINGQSLLLEEGDSLFFDGRLPHVPINTSESSCQLFVIYFFLKIANLNIAIFKKILKKCFKISPPTNSYSYFFGKKLFSFSTNNLTNTSIEIVV